MVIARLMKNRQRRLQLTDVEGAAVGGNGLGVAILRRGTVEGDDCLE